MNSMLLPASAAAMLLGGLLLFFNIARLLALLRDSDVVSSPVVPEQGLHFAAAGNYILEVEQPRLSTAMRGAQFQLLEVLSGEAVPSSPILFRSTRAGFSSARISERSFQIARSGSYRLRISGLAPAADVSAVQVIFTRPHTVGLVFRILGIVLGGILTIGGTVFLSLRLTGKL